MLRCAQNDRNGLWAGFENTPKWNFANGEILLKRLRLIACAVSFGGPLIAGRKAAISSS